MSAMSVADELRRRFPASSNRNNQVGDLARMRKLEAIQNTQIKVEKLVILLTILAVNDVPG
jgi:hypothetical protein